jgi:hypothetical protein
MRQDHKPGVAGNGPVQHRGQPVRAASEKQGGFASAMGHAVITAYLEFDID